MGFLSDNVVILSIILIIGGLYLAECLSGKRCRAARASNRRAANKTLSACNGQWAALVDDLKRKQAQREAEYAEELRGRDELIAHLQKQLELNEKVMSAPLRGK